MNEKITAPFTPDQAASLNSYQVSGLFHEYTCGGEPEDCPARRTLGSSVLIATVDGWRCPYCNYQQDWALAWMADWSWDGGHFRYPSDPNSEPG